MSRGIARLFIEDTDGEQSIIERRGVTFAQAMREATALMGHKDISYVDVDFEALPTRLLDRTATPHKVA